MTTPLRGKPRRFKRLTLADYCFEAAAGDPLLALLLALEYRDAYKAARGRV